MDSANLHNSVFNIELKRSELEHQNATRSEVKRWFEDNYRVFSKKSAFTCLSCNKPVSMNLTNEDGRPFFFRHNDESECSYSKNSKTYDKHVSKLEDKSKKDVGLTIFREILEGELKPYDVEIERGNLYKKKLSFIPDFIIKFPNSEERWAIDYFTAIDQGLTSGSYARHLAKRMRAYKEEGFKNISFVDYSWLSFLEETNKGTLLNAEIHITSKTHEDYLWDTFLEENLVGELWDFFIKDTGATVKEFNTKNIAYVDVSNRLCTLIRIIPIAQHDRNITFYKLSSSKITLNQALSVNTDQNYFELSKENEDDKRAGFLKEIIEKKQQFVLKQKDLKEEQEGFREEEVIVKQEEKKQRARLRLEKADRLQKKEISLELQDKQIEKDMEERIRKAAARPIEMHPNHWDYHKNRQNQYSNSNYTFQQKSPSSSVENTVDRIDKKKKEEVLDLLLSQPIKGEMYINGDKKVWRKLVLKWIKENQASDSLVVSLQQLIDDMKNAGVSFNQQDKIVIYPLKDFLAYYQKTLKVELKKKIELIINDKTLLPRK